MNESEFQVPGYSHYSYTWTYTMTTDAPLTDEEKDAIGTALLDADVPMPESILKVFTSAEPEPFRERV